MRRMGVSACEVCASGEGRAIWRSLHHVEDMHSCSGAANARYAHAGRRHCIISDALRAHSTSNDGRKLA